MKKEEEEEEIDHEEKMKEKDEHEELFNSLYFPMPMGWMKRDLRTRTRI